LTAYGLNNKCFMANRTITKESLLEAATTVAAGYQDEQLRLLDKMLKDQPALLKFLEYLDGTSEHAPTKEIILQLMMIFYYAILVQKIKVAKIPYSDFLDSIFLNIIMKEYYDDPDEPFQKESFEVFFDNYPQKEILHYTNVALNDHYNEYITEEQEAAHIFYVMKIFGEVVDQNIIE